MYYIVRHGQTEKNKKNLLQGRSNLPLNEEGRRQAAAAGEYFRKHGIVFDEIYSSPLDRAVETALLIAGENQEIITDERLLEMDYGPYEGIDLADPPAEIITFFKDFVHNPAPDGMEQLSDVVRRTGEFMEEIKGSDKNILISLHAISMKGILEYLTPGSGGSWWSRYIGNCDIYCLENRDGEYGIPKKIERKQEAEF